MRFLSYTVAAMFILEMAAFTGPAAAQVDTNFSDGAVILGTSGPACSGTYEGAIRYNTSYNCMQVCNGSDWRCLCTSSSDVVTSGLENHWKLDEGSGTTAADSAGSLDGSFVDSPTWIEGPVGGALSFDGSNDAVLVDSSAPSDDTLFSLSLWVRTTNSNNRNAFIRGNGGSCVYLPGVNTSGAYIDGCNGLNFISFSQSIDDGEWHHVVFIRNGSDLTLYLDGSLDGTMTKNAEGKSSSDIRTYIGAMWNFGGSSAPGGWWDGDIDDVRLYSDELTSGEVSTLYNAGCPQ